MEFQWSFWLAIHWIMRWCSPSQTKPSVLCVRELAPMCLLLWSCLQRPQGEVILDKPCFSWAPPLVTSCSHFSTESCLQVPRLGALGFAHDLLCEAYLLPLISACPGRQFICRTTSCWLPRAAELAGKDLTWCHPARLTVDSLGLADVGLVGFLTLPCPWTVLSMPRQLGESSHEDRWVLVLLFPPICRSSEKLFGERIKLLETVIPSLVRHWPLLNNVHFF